MLLSLLLLLLLLLRISASHISNAQQSVNTRDETGDEGVARERVRDLIDWKSPFLNLRPLPPVINVAAILCVASQPPPHPLQLEGDACPYVCTWSK